jgi:hypothetical protein
MAGFSGKQEQPTLRRRINNASSARNNKRGGSSSGLVCSPALVIAYFMVGMVFMYATCMVMITRYSHPTVNGVQKPPPRVFSPKELADQVDIPALPIKREFGHGVKPDSIIVDSNNHHHHDEDPADLVGQNRIPDSILTAYLEPIDQSTWDTKPLPLRTSTAEDLTKIQYSKLTSCSKLPEQFPVDDYPNGDPFLPWIHDVFPTADGKFIQFVAQNKRRCRTGTTPDEQEILTEQQPQIALFQHVALKRINSTTATATASSPPRYRLSSHEQADPDAMTTRFICRFKPSGEETLSVFNVDYEWGSYRKKHKKMFSLDGHKDNKNIHTSQLNFKCPVPPHLVDIIASGKSVIQDYATLFVDVIPIRTPPRYGAPNQFFPPYYKEFLSEKDEFDANEEWGDNHILPRVEDAGRWENIPICKPTLQTYENDNEEEEQELDTSTSPVVKKHKLVSCLWASTGYATRGNRFAINDGQRRLLEWITYNKLIGFDHFYVYDNSGAFGDDTHPTLQPIADMFPNDVTLINWPAQVCNNNPNNVDSVGERSSQYAAESSCRLRFGPHVDWIGQFDIDEYLVPMGNLTSVLPLLDKLDQEGNKIISFGSWRAWPRRKFIE